MNYVRSNNLSLKYQRCWPSGCKDIGIRKFEFVAKTQFLSKTSVTFKPETETRFFFKRSICQNSNWIFGIMHGVHIWIRGDAVNAG